VFRAVLGPKASIKLPSEAFLAVYNGVYVPWNGGTGRLMVNRPMLGTSTTITVDNYPVATVSRATLENPWVETAFPQAEPKQLIVVQVQPEPVRFGILVFVDGVCLQAGGATNLGRDARSKSPTLSPCFNQQECGDSRGSGRCCSAWRR
jgi:hypothetical protein